VLIKNTCIVPSLALSIQIFEKYADDETMPRCRAKYIGDFNISIQFVNQF